jgi:hypothetical protein
LNYGSVLRWQLRAQNAADAASRGLLSVQTTQWNQTVAALHATAIEEYRIRYLIRDLGEVIRGNGGCDNSAGASGPTSCDAMYANLKSAYIAAIQRYTNDLQILNNANAPTQAQQVAAIKNALAKYEQNCGNPNGGDCAFHYTLVAWKIRRDSTLHDVYADCCGATIGGNTTGNPKTDLNPLEIEVVACANVPPAMPPFFKFTATPPNVAIGRAAATSIMATQEFMYVGSIVNPDTKQVFQPAEFPESSNNLPVFGDDDPYYRIDYGGNPDNPYNNGNPAISNGTFAFTYTPGDQGVSANLGWWTAMSVKPFAGQITAGVDFTCK